MTEGSSLTPQSAVPPKARLSRVNTDRRAFLGWTGASALLAGSSFGVGRAAAQRPTRRTGSDPNKAKNVIFMVSDGMSQGTLTLAHMLRRVRDGRDSNWISMWGQPGARRALARTHSADSLVTDSAAGGCAWSIGEHINNDVLNVTPDGRMPTPLLVHAKQNGKATGLVTTTRLTHATPASFLVNMPKRSMEDQIGPQMLERGFDVALGGGGKYITPAVIAKYPSLRVARDESTLTSLAAAAETTPLLGVFADSHCPYELDRTANVPSLTKMTRAALDVLSRRSDGFVLQIEGGRVDHGAHANDAGSILFEQLEFDNAIGVVADFVKDRDDTLVIITTDHANANPGLTLYGRESYLAFERLSKVRHSFEWLFAKVDTKIAYDDPAHANDFKTVGGLPAAVLEATNVELTAAQVAQLTAAMQGKPTMPFAAMNGATSVLGQVLANSLGVSFISPNHTADMVEVTAMGPGSERLAPAIDNIDLHAMMVKAMDLAPAKPIA
jgi:alkaline phosphatase